MSGFVLAEEAHVVNALPPIDLNGGKNTDVWDMADYASATIIVQLGVSAGAVPTMKVQACDDFTPSNTVDKAFTYYAETTSDGDTLAAKATAASTGLALSQNNNVYYVIEFDARELGDGYSKMRLSFSDPSASVIGSVVAILSGARFAGSPATHGTAIA